MTVSEYHPHRHAKNHHQLLFTHAKKFSLRSPCLIVFVLFPWFSEKISLGDGNNTEFYRAFARRFFCQYATTAAPAHGLLKAFTGSETLAQITEKLSGVLFLEDRSIESPTPTATNVSGFAYLNPNAVNEVGRHFRHHLQELGCPIDDFEHDNY
jgi:hypothetical protein